MRIVLASNVTRPYTIGSSTKYFSNSVRIQRFSVNFQDIHIKGGIIIRYLYKSQPYKQVRITRKCCNH